jgi:hypothetical protein
MADCRIKNWNSLKKEFVRWDILLTPIREDKDTILLTM